MRQGAVLSPMLFTVYVDDILSNLKKSGLGCHVNEVYVGCLMYADDLLLLSCSLSMLQKMLHVCKEEMEQICMNFNASKFTVVRFGESLDIHAMLYYSIEQHCSSLLKLSI